MAPPGCSNLCLVHPTSHSVNSAEHLLCTRSWGCTCVAAQMLMSVGKKERMPERWEHIIALLDCTCETILSISDSREGGRGAIVPRSERQVRGSCAGKIAPKQRDGLVLPPQTALAPVQTRTALTFKCLRGTTVRLAVRSDAPSRWWRFSPWGQGLPCALSRGVG